MGCASVAYKLRAVAVRPSFSHNIQAKAPVFILRSLTSEALEYQQTVDIESTWPEKLMYAIILPHKAWAAGDTLTAIVKLSPLAKGVYVQAIDSSITEKTKILVGGVSREDTRVVASARQEMIIDHHKTVNVEVAPPNSSATAASSSSLGTLAAAHSPRSSRPASPHFGSSSSYHHSHHSPPPSPPQQQEVEDLGFESNDIITSVNLSIPQSSAYPFLYSASNAASPTATPPWSSSPTLQHALLPLSSTNSATSQPTSPTSLPLSSHPIITPSHDLEPIFISHRIKWTIFIHNKDGHVSELRCSLPIRILDGALLEESRGFTMRLRRLLHRTNGLGSVLSRSGEEGSDDEGDEGAGIVDGEAGRIRQMEADRELPSYPAHVRDRVANIFLPDAATMLVSNPWIGRVGPSEFASESGASSLSTPELSGQRESDILNPLMPVVSPGDPVSATLHTQPDSSSGHNTPDIQSSQQQARVMFNLSLSLLDIEAVRRIQVEDAPDVGGQQQPQPHQHQHQIHDQQHRQHGRTFRWGSRVGSREGSRTTSPERRIALSSVTTNNNDNGPSSISEGGVNGSPNSIVSSSSSPFASPFQNLFKATIKPFTALTGHHGHTSHRPTHSLSRSTTSLMELRSLSALGPASDVGAGATPDSGQQPSALIPDSSLTCPSSGGAGQNFSSAAPSLALQNETNGFISDSCSSTPSLAANGMAASSSSSPSSSFDLGLKSTSPTCPSRTIASASQLSHTISRVFSVVPDYNIASRGFMGGIPPLSSMHGLPSYEEAETQRKGKGSSGDATIQSQIMQKTRLPIQNQQGQTVIQTQMQTLQIQNKVVDEEEKMKMKMRMKERGSMSEPDLAGRFGHIGVCLESGMQALAETEAGTSHSMQSGTSGSVGIVQRLHDGEDDDEGDDDDDTDTRTIQMHIKKARP